jgi:hypothetical protein
MKKLFASVLAALGLGAASAPAKESPGADGNVMQGLRMQALSLKAEGIGLNRAKFPKDVWGILLETGYETGAFSLVVLGDGTASLYFSTGGGIIGAGQHDAVRTACANLLAGANQFVSAASPTTTFPLPAAGRVTFYFLSYSGVLSYSAQEIELGEGRDKLSALFHAGHEVIARMREIEQARQGTASKSNAPNGARP